jgi:hypothetical protein
MLVWILGGFSMRAHGRFLLLVVAGLAATVAACTADAPRPAATPARPEPATPAGFSAAWAADPLWDDGRGEVAFYDARRPVYGRPTDYPATLIVVKEDLDAGTLVKADAPLEGRELLPVLKLAADHRFDAPTMPYRFSLTAFVRRDAPSRLVKLVFGAQEWCGITFKRLQPAGIEARLDFHSYFDGDASGTHAVEFTAADLAEDQLAVALRGLEFAEGLEVRTRIVPTLASLRVPGPPEPLAAVIRVAGEESYTLGRVREAAWKVDVSFGEVRQSWWLAAARPHTVLAMESSDGRSLRLRSVTRAAYWSQPLWRP